MYRIGLLDDEKEELNKIKEALKSYEKIHSEIDFIIENFESAEELLKQIREKSFVPDLLFMDIYMSEKSGVETAKELRGMGYKGKIIFITVSREHALDAFGVGASQYLVKPVSKRILSDVLDQFLEEMKEARRRFVFLKIGGKIQRVAVKDIVYCEAQGKVQHLYLSNDTCCLYHGTLKEIYEMLSGYPEFVRVGMAYIVNMEHIGGMSAQELQMDNGKKIFPPRGSYSVLREQYFSYYCGEE